MLGSHQKTGLQRVGRRRDTFPSPNRFLVFASRPLSCATLLLMVACGRGDTATSDGTPRFAMTEVAAPSGLVFTPTSGGTPTSQLLEVKSGGLALIDYDGDGDLDVFVPNGATLDAPMQGPGARLFENLGDMKFQDSTEAAGLELQRWSMGCAVGDIDGDGRDDLFVACFGRNALFRSRADGTLEDITDTAGLTREDWSTSAAFGDLDGDGDLDLYVTNYVEFDPAAPPSPMNFRGARVFGGPMGLPGVGDRVHENLGDGRFRDVTAAWGFDAVEPSFGLGVVVLDLDGDARAEVLVGNDSQPNFLFQRGDDGRFRDVGLDSGLALDENGWGQATMGIAIGDVNGDGRPDVFSSNFMSDHDTLHVNLGGLRFDDHSRRSGLALATTPFLGWGCAFVDLDQEGTEELLVFHGHVYPETITAPMGWRRDQEPQLFERVEQRWVQVPPEDGGAWLSNAHRDRGAAFGDLDGDGDLDVVVHELAGPVRLLRNDAAVGSWLRVGLRDERSGIGNRRGLGAQVTVSWGTETRHRWIASGTSYQSASAMEAHFGLGQDPGPLQVDVRWPDGHVQTLDAVTAGQVLEVVRK